MSVAASVACVRRHAVEIGLVTFTLATRVALLSISLDEVDSANFVNALLHGYDVPNLRPHPPGYPIYVLLGNLVYLVVPSPLLALTLLSAVLGSLTTVFVFWLLDEIAGRTCAILGALLFAGHPLIWSFSETALSDVPAMFFASWAAWLLHRGCSSAVAFLAAAIVVSLAIGVRQSNVVLLALPIVPLIYYRGLPWNARLGFAVAWAAVFAVVTTAWAVAMVVTGSNGFDDYIQAVTKQWSTAVVVYDWSQVESPRLLNLLFRFERFFYAYFLTSSWTGDDAKTPLTLLLISPWLLGFALFVVGFEARRASHMLIAVWIASVGYVVVSIHFLARYALPQAPAFLIACLMGFAFLRSLAVHRWRAELGAVLGLACTLILYGIKYQPPVGAFEYTPPPGSMLGGLLVTSGIVLVLAVRILYWRSGPAPSPVVAPDAAPWPRGWLVAAGVLVAMVGAQGYAVASVAHVRKSPSHQLVEFVKTHYGSSPLTPCWDNLTHSSFEVLLPEAPPTGFWTVRELYRAHAAGRTLIVTDQCVWHKELTVSPGLAEVASFEGRGPLWMKAPALRLFVAAHPAGGGRP